MMNGCSRLRLGSALVAVCGAAAFGHAETVYDDSYTYEDTFYPNVDREYGDEIILGGSARTVVDFRFEYYGSFTPSGNETARVRFYANDGVGDPGFKAPGSLLYDSGTFLVFPGFNTKALRGLSVLVPGRLTWTVQFYGLDGSAFDQAGLTFYDPPPAGFSFNDFWRLDPDLNDPTQPPTWNLYHYDPPLVANFGAKITALPDPGARVTIENVSTTGEVALAVTGPVGRRFVLQFSDDLTNWAPASTNLLSQSPMPLPVDGGGTIGTRFYLARLLPATVPAIGSPVVLTNGRFRLSYDGPTDRRLAIEQSTNLRDWTLATVKTFVGEPVTFDDPAAASSDRFFYRGEMLPEPPTVIGQGAFLPNGLFQIPLSGRPGHDYIVYASPDLFLNLWTAIATNVFTFNQGYSDFVDPTSTNGTPRFYLIAPVP